MKQRTKRGFPGMVLGTLGSALLENMWAGKGVKRPKSSNIPGRGVMRDSEGTIKASQDFNAASSFN